MIGKLIWLPTHLAVVKDVIGHRDDVKGKPFIVVTVGDTGFAAVDSPVFETEEESVAFADRHNGFKMEDELAEAAVCGSMFGWSCPAAAPIIRLLKLKG